MAEKTFSQIDDHAFHFQPNGITNSIAINITHMHGNMLSRWTNFLTEDGEKSWRQRDDEFEIHSYSKENYYNFGKKAGKAFSMHLNP